MTIYLTSLVESPEDPRDYPFALDKTNVLPASIDLMPDVYEVEDQGRVNSCTANAGCSALELMYKRAGQPKDFSRLYLYFRERELAGIKGDLGAIPRDIGMSLLKFGACLEETWPYTPENVVNTPSAAADAEAAQFKIKRFENLQFGQGGKILPYTERRNNIKHALAHGCPVLLTMWVHESFLKIKTPWREDSGWSWFSGDGNNFLGLHEVLIIGYDEECERFLCMNSWGPEWGDGGFFGLPYKYIGGGPVFELFALYPQVDLIQVENYKPAVVPEPIPAPVPESALEPVKPEPTPEPPKPEPTPEPVKPEPTPEPVPPPPVHPEREANDSQKRDVFFIGLIILLVVVAKLLKLW